MKQQNSVKVVCDKGCKKVFVISKPQEKKLDDDVIEHLIRCPYCRKEYSIFFSNAASRRIRQKLNDKNSKSMSESQRKLLIQEMNNIENRLRDRFQKC